MAAVMVAMVDAGRNVQLGPPGKATATANVTATLAAAVAIPPSAPSDAAAALTACA